MSEENKNQITYDEDWQSVSRSEYPARVNEFDADTYGDDNTESKNKIPKKKKALLSSILLQFSSFCAS